MVLLSKFERYKKKSEPYVYPHKHCEKCGEMIEESMRFCANCYEKIKTKKEKKKSRFKRRRREIKNEEDYKE